MRLQPQKLLCLTMKGKGRLGGGGAGGGCSAQALEFVASCLSASRVASCSSSLTSGKEKKWSSFPTYQEGLILFLSCVMCCWPDPGHLPARTFIFTSSTKRNSCAGISLVGVFSQVSLVLPSCFQHERNVGVSEVRVCLVEAGCLLFVFGCCPKTQGRSGQRQADVSWELVSAPPDLFLCRNGQVCNKPAVTGRVFHF